MSDFLFFIPVVIIFGMMYFLDLVFKSCMFFPYIKFLYNTGLTIKPFVICWETTYFNRPFMRCGSIKSNCLRRWFQVGAFIVSLSVIPALCLLFVPVFQFFAYKEVTPVLMPIIPGLNLPYSQLLYYSLALFICVAFHEFGHALAASREKVPIEGLGINMFGIFPVAYVRISTEHLRQISLAQQLRIYSAGIWHNLVLAGFCLAVVSANPFVLKPLYQQENGITVIDVKQGSGLSQEGGLMKEDTITGVNQCLVKNPEDWRECIHHEYSKKEWGYCVEEAFYKKKDTSIKRRTPDCCPENSKNMCFRIKNNSSLYLFLGPNKYFEMEQDLGYLMCLPARELAESAKICFDYYECGSDLCLVPVLDSGDDRLLEIKLHSKKSVFYVGQMEEIFSSVAVSPWVSNYAPVYYIDMLELLLGYVLSFSCGLAIFNTVPLFCLNGKYIIECIVKGYLVSFIYKLVYRHRLIFALKMMGCIGMLLCILIAAFKLF